MTATKPTNPKDMIGIKKTPFSTLPWPVMAEVALAMLEGAAKYGRHNYRAAGVRASVYFDAAMRHMTDWWEGADHDHDSSANLHHITKAIASLMVLRDAMIRGMAEDDRPPSSPDGWQQELNDQAAKILDDYSDKSPHHHTIKDVIDVEQEAP